ncbi:MAG: peptidylprolyl isomerase [Anaerolineaceae bacterium]
MADNKVPPKQVTKKHLAKQEKEQRQTRSLLIGTVIVLVLVIGLVGYVLIDTYVVKPAKVVASVGETDITVRQYQPAVKYTRMNLINQANQYYYYSQLFGDMGSSFLSTAQEMITSLNSPATIGEDVINNMINEVLIQEEAEKRGITVSAEEVEAAIKEAFNFYPNGTSTPTITPTIVNTPTMSRSQIAIIQPTNTPTPLPTATSTPDGWVPTNTATATPSATATSQPVPTDATPTEVPTATTEPTITPTPTAFTTQVYGKEVKDYYSNLDDYGIGRETVEEAFRMQILREKLMESVTADLKPVQSQVWARHILVATEDEANTVLDALKAGEDWNTLAATYSTDTSNKDNGGDLGWFGRGTMDTTFEEAAFALEEGEISQPVKTDFGYHIIQCVGKGENNLNASDFATYKQTTFTTWLSDLRDARTDIVINDIWTEYTPDTPAVPTSLQDAIYGIQ